MVMSRAALTSGGKEGYHLVTARPENPGYCRFHPANMDAVPVIAKVAGRDYGEIAFNAPSYSRPITGTRSEIRSTPGRHELVFGGFS